MFRVSILAMVSVALGYLAYTLYQGERKIYNAFYHLFPF